MAAITALLNQLEINSSVFVIFGIFFLFYIVVSQVLFNKVLEVLVLREGKTTKLEEQANEVFEKATKLAKEYHLKMDEAYSKSYEKFHHEKNEVLNSNKDVIAKRELELQDKINKEKESYKNSLEASREKVLGESSELSNELVDKLIG